MKDLTASLSATSIQPIRPPISARFTQPIPAVGAQSKPTISSGTFTQKANNPSTLQPTIAKPSGYQQRPVAVAPSGIGNTGWTMGTPANNQSSTGWTMGQTSNTQSMGWNSGSVANVQSTNWTSGSQSNNQSAGWSMGPSLGYSGPQPSNQTSAWSFNSSTITPQASSGMMYPSQSNPLTPSSMSAPLQPQPTNNSALSRNDINDLLG